ncbi:hypothetical protein [Deinococcus sp. QL22]|uniref:hypothetical protein n=1 Tax=Deinococcus sp. QL22 TaxID=2939437 RepID=UPI002016C92F|nr:hypothetical protein [Deinococcus sp. QL22]UQN06293.1 hypothetical protein M1R55_15760 [Deinococcus sp. QL22]
MKPVDRLLLDPEPLTPELLGLADQNALKTRLTAYLRLAGFVPDPAQLELQPTEVQRQHAVALIYGARIVVLEEKVEEFEAVGEVKIKQAVMARVARLTVLRDAALAAMQVVPAEDSGGLSFAPTLTAWGVEP